MRRQHRHGGLPLGGSGDLADFVADCRAIKVTPHVAQNTKNRASAIDGRTTRHPGHAISQIIRKLIETRFGDGKQYGILRQLKLRGLDRAGRCSRWS